MKYSEEIFSLMGDEGRKVVSRLMGLIVLAISIQFIINGIGDVLRTTSGSQWRHSRECPGIVTSFQGIRPQTLFPAYLYTQYHNRVFG